MTTFLVRAFALLLFIAAPILRAQVPQIINYQGRVAVGTVNFDGSGSFRFALVNAAGTVTYWSNDGTSTAGSQPTAAVTLPVTKGLYSVLLGDTALAGMIAVPASVFTNADVRLRVWFNDGTNGSQLLTPDQRLAPNGYLPDASVSSAAIASGAITSAKIASGAVGGTQLASGLTLGGSTSGTFTGNGAGLTALTATNLTGTIADTRLSGNVALLNAANTFSANQTVSGAVGIGTAASAATVLHVVSPNANARILFESSVSNGNPTLVIKANSPAGEADITTDRADTGASAAHNFLTGGVMEWTLRTPNFTSGEPNRLDLGNAASTPVITFRQNGNVGIGKSSPATALDVNGTATATSFVGSGAGLTGITVPAGSITGNITGAQLANNTVGSTQLASGLTLGGTTSGTFTGSGAGLTALTAANLSGTIADARLSSNVALLNAANTFSANQTVSGAVGIGTAASAATVLHVVSPNANARILFESSVSNGNPTLVVKANSPAGEADITTDRADTGASAAHNFLTGGVMEWTLRTPNFTSGEPNRLDLGNAASTPVITFRQNGNVGIGKSSPATALDVNGTATATSFVGSGAGLTGITVAAGSITGSITGAQLANNTVGSTQLASGLTLGGSTAGTFTGSGAGLTALTATNLTGTIADARLSGNVALLNAANTFSANQTVSGAVGIGTAAATATVLHVVSPNANARILFESSVSNGNPTLVIKANSPAGEADITTDRADTGASAAHNFLTGGVMEWTLRTPNFTTGEPSRLELDNGASTPVMIFRQNGNVGIGRSPATNKLEVEGTASMTTAGSWLANSDRRIKEDIQIVGHALDTLDKVRLVDFRYTQSYRREHPTIEDKRYLNVVAQEFAEVFPDHVKNSGEKLADGSEILQVDTYPLTIYSAAAVQELHKETNALREENAELRKRLDKLEAFIRKGSAQ